MSKITIKERLQLIKELDRLRVLSDDSFDIEQALRRINLRDVAIIQLRVRMGIGERIHFIMKQLELRN